MGHSPVALAEIERNLIQTDEPGRLMRPGMVEAAQEVAKNEGVPLTGLALLGGKFYINSTGLDVKLDNICKEKGWTKVRVEAVFVEGSEHESEDGQYRVGFRGIVELFDKAGFMEALRIMVEKMPAEKLSPEFIKDMKSIFTNSYQNEGWAGHASIRMSTLKNKDMMRMMAATRALNRAKRQATGTGLTSVEELDVEPPVPQRPSGKIIDQQPTGNVQDHPDYVPPPGVRKVVFVVWKNKESVEANGYLVENEFRQQVGEMATWHEARKRYVMHAAMATDFINLCGRHGYEVEIDDSAKDEPPRQQQATTPQAAAPQAKLGVIEEVRGPKKWSNGKTYYEVRFSGRWLFVTDEPLFEYVAKAAGLAASFVIEEHEKYPKIRRIARIGMREFDENSKPVRTTNDLPGDKLF